jgi:hypothetical protein
MADVFGNSLLNLTTATETILYTCPIVSDSIDGGTDNTAQDIVTYAQQAVTQSQVTSIIVCSLTTSTYSIYLTDATTPAPSASTPHHFALFNLVAITAPASHVISPGLVLAPGQTLWVEAGDANALTVTVNYIEIS